MIDSVEELGIKGVLPAYLDPNLKPEDLLTGVNFASGAAGYDPLTSQLSVSIYIYILSCVFFFQESIFFFFF